LDEPTNGLDPLGILAFREVLRKLSQEKGTAIFFSSHYLSELEKIIDRALFIDKGELVFCMEHKKGYIYHITVSDALKATKLLESKGLTATSKAKSVITPSDTPCSIDQNESKGLTATAESESVIVFSGTENVSNVMTLLHNGGINVLDVERKESDLESIFYNLFVEE